MKQRMKRWWNIAPLWPILFSILYGVDVAKVDIDRPLDLFHLVETFRKEGKASVAYPEVFPVISGMLKTGVGTIVTTQGETRPQESNTEDWHLSPNRARRRSLSLNDSQGMF